MSVVSVYKDARWITVRERIKKRDKHTCTKCKLKKKNLHVHHLIYIKGNRVWEIPDRYLVTLCAECHEKEHENKPISKFVKKPTKRNFSKKELKKIKNYNKKLVVKQHVPTRENTSWFDWDI